MYGCIYPCVIYGWCENDTENVICEEWLKEHYENEDWFKDIYVYATGTTRNHGATPVYGVECDLDSQTGKVTPPDWKAKKVVDELFERIFKGKINANECKLGYYTAVAGDYDICWQTYAPELEE